MNTAVSFHVNMEASLGVLCITAMIGLACLFVWQALK